MTCSGISEISVIDLSKINHFSRSVRSDVMAMNSCESLPPIAPPSPMIPLKSSPARVKIFSYAFL